MTAAGGVSDRGLCRILFPDPPRDFPGRRAMRTSLRAAHVITGGIFLGGHVFTVSRDALLPWMLATFVTGGLLVLMDLHASFAVCFEVRAILVLAKFLLFASIIPLWEARVWLLVAAAVIGVVGSHMPGRYRHRLLWLRHRVVVDDRKG